MWMWLILLFQIICNALMLMNSESSVTSMNNMISGTATFLQKPTETIHYVMKQISFTNFLILARMLLETILILFLGIIFLVGSCIICLWKYVMQYILSENAFTEICHILKNGPATMEWWVLLSVLLLLICTFLYILHYGYGAEISRKHSILVKVFS